MKSLVFFCVFYLKAIDEEFGLFLCVLFEGNR